MNDGITPTTEKPSLDRELFNQWFEENYQKKLQEQSDNDVGKLSIIATKGTMDMAYPPFILASTAAALDWEVSVFFTFYGLDLLKKMSPWKFHHWVIRPCR